MTAELSARLAEYHVLALYDRMRFVRYGDMAAARRDRELARLAGALVDAGVPVDHAGNFPVSTAAELVAAFERVARPRVRRLERETAPVTLANGTVYTGTRTRYNGTSLDTWRELARNLGASA